VKANIDKIRETSRDYVRRESGFCRELAVIDPVTGRTPVIARFYWPGSVCYCALWISGGERYGRGQGKAGGGGYHKTSAALADAIDDAGVKLSESISGVGDSAMESACLAVAKAVTRKRRLIVHVAHA
jgi:hypothetical protein